MTGAKAHGFQPLHLRWTKERVENELVHGKRDVTPDTVLRLAKLFNTTAEFWLRGQLAYDLWYAMRSPQAKVIETLEPIAT